MEKDGDVRRGGSSGFSTPMPQTEKGGDGDVVLDKSSKKEKLRRLSSVGKLGEMDQLSNSIKPPSKFSGHCDTINHASVPRKLRSAMKKRQLESQKNCAVAVSPVLQDSRNGIDRFELLSKDCTKKLKTDVEEHKNSKTFPRESVITKDEEEVAEALFALARTFPSADLNNLNGTSEAEPSSLPGSLVVQESMHTKTLNEAEIAKDVADGMKLRKRCSVHVYICRFIKVLQTTESKMSSFDKGWKQGARVNVISDANPPTITNEYVGDASNEAENAHKRPFLDQQQVFNTISLAASDGSGVESITVADRPETTKDAASMQYQDHACMHLTNPQNHRSFSVGHLSPAAAEQVPQYFDTMHYDCSQCSTQILSKQQSWKNQFISRSCHQNWQNGRHDAMTHVSSSSLEIFGSKYAQGSLQEVLGSKHTLNAEQQQKQQQQYIPMSSVLASNKGKMQFSHRPSYDEQGGLFFVDSAPTLKLTL